MGGNSLEEEGKGIYGIKDVPDKQAEGSLTPEETAAKEKIDALELKKAKMVGYKFLVVCFIICVVLGFIAFAIENVYQKKLMKEWESTYGAPCAADSDFPDNPRWNCPKEMTSSEFSSGGKKEYLAFLPFISGMASGFIFGFIDNAG